MCDPTMAPMQGIQVPSTLTSSKNRGGGGDEEDNQTKLTTEQHKMAPKSTHVGCWVFMSTGSCSLHYDP